MPAPMTTTSASFTGPPDVEGLAGLSVSSSVALHALWPHLPTLCFCADLDMKDGHLSDAHVLGEALHGLNGKPTVW